MSRSLNIESIPWSNQSAQTCDLQEQSDKFLWFPSSPVIIAIIGIIGTIGIVAVRFYFYKQRNTQNGSDGIDMADIRDMDEESDDPNSAPEEEDDMKWMEVTTDPGIDVVYLRNPRVKSMPPFHIFSRNDGRNKQKPHTKSTSQLPFVPTNAVSEEFETLSECVENTKWLKQLPHKLESNRENISMKDMHKVGELKKELQTLWQHPTAMDHWNLIATAIDYAYPSNSQLSECTHHNQRITSSMYSECKYCMSYAAYSYFMPMIGVPQHLTIETRNIDLPSTEASGVADPGYFLGIDHGNQRILLCIRGTATLGDVITDLDAFPTEKQPFGNGKSYYVHPGMYDAATKLEGEITAQIKRYTHEYPRFKLLVTGHSLGAGVCAILGLLWNTKQTFKRKRFSCYSFASPPVIDEDGMKASLRYNNMISVAVTTDIVTRLSAKTVFTLAERVKIIEGYHDDEALVNRIVAARERSQSEKQFKEKLGERERELIAKLRKADGGSFGLLLKTLYPCGDVIWFMPEFDGMNESHRYQNLLRATRTDCQGGFCSQVIKMIPHIIKDFYVVNTDEILHSLNSTTKDRFEFTQLVCHGHESLHAHFPGRYTNGFKIDIIDIFKMSQWYYLISVALYPLLWIPGVESLLVLWIQVFMFIPVAAFAVSQSVYNLLSHFLRYKCFYFYLFLFELIGNMFTQKK